MNKLKNVYVVTEFNQTDEPIVTVFNQKDVAEKFAKLIHRGDGRLEESECCIDECPVYSDFMIWSNEDEKEIAL